MLCQLNFSHGESLQLQRGKNRDLANEVDVLCRPPNRLFLGVMGMGAECEMGEGNEKKCLGTQQMLYSFTDIFALLSSWRGVSLPIITQLATQCSSPRYLGKLLVKDAYPEKFSQCPITRGCLIAEVEPHNNEWVPNNDGLVPNNDGLVAYNDGLVPNNDGQVLNDKNQCLIMMNLCLIITKQA